MNILLAVDNSPHSKVAVDVLLSRSWPDGSTFKVFCSVERRDPIFAVLKTDEAKDIQTRALESAQRFVVETANQIQSAFPKCTVIHEAKFGDCKEDILAHSSWPVDLIVMGSHGRHGIPRFVLGSVSQTVLLHGQCPMLIARYQTAHANEDIASFDRNILIAVDDSEHSRSALEWTMSLPWPEDAKFALLSVIPLVVDTFADGFDALHSRSVPNVRSEQLKVVREFLDSSVVRFKKGIGDNLVTSQIVEGDPANEILTKAQDWPAGLIIIGSRAQGRMQRVFMGSVSQEVVLQAPCPVEVVKTKPKS